MEYLPTLSICVVLTFTLYFWHLDHQSMKDERKDLYDRLMSRNIVEYKELNTPEPNELPVTDPSLVEIDQAREEIMPDGSDE